MTYFSTTGLGHTWPNGIWVASLRTTDYGLRTTDYGLLVGMCGTRSADLTLQYK